MSNNEELNKILDDYEKDVKKLKIDKIDTQKELEYRKKVEHESDYMMGEITKKLQIKVSRENLFMNDITREELK